MPATFISRARDFRVVLHPSLPQTDVTGITRHVPGRSAQFTDNHYVARDDAEAEQLRQALTFNREFWEKGHGPGAILPATEDVLVAVTQAAIRKNVQKLREIIATEESTHQRQDILVAARTALGELGEPDGKRGPGRPPKAQAA